MFTLITPAVRGRHKDLLCRIFATREGYYDSGLATSMEKFDTPSTSYIAYEDPQNGVFGSARLNKLTDSPARFFYRRHFSERLMKTFREVSFITFTMEEDHPSQTQEGVFDVAIQDFYRGLYDFLISVSISQNLDGYVTFMDADEHPDLTFFGSWDFEDTHTVLIENQSITLGELPLGSAVGYALRPPLLAA